MSEKWQALILFCVEHPFCTIEKLEIHNGEPNLLIYQIDLTNKTTVKVKLKI